MQGTKPTLLGIFGYVLLRDFVSVSSASGDQR